uniref:arsenate reductase family protein n=1 Tax=Flavobacterium sp. TaxID=239 RepID=UPI00404AE85A
MDTIYYLPSCDTCRKIIKMLPKGIQLDFQDIRENPIDEETLAKMYALSGSYEALFSKRAQLYKERGLKDKNLTEEDYKALILEHYTFLSRPVFIINNEIFIGNSQPNILKLMKTLGNV